MVKRRKKGMAVLKAAGILLLVLLAIVLIYLAYVIFSYKRLPDNMELSVTQDADRAKVLSAGEEYTIATYNIGFGAYTPDFSFFMDGGKSS